jgi:hypothetical protein
MFTRIFELSTKQGKNRQLSRYRANTFSALAIGTRRGDGLPNLRSNKPS